MSASTPEQQARYLETPRKCVDCGGDPSAGRPRCDRCHSIFQQPPTLEGSR